MIYANRFVFVFEDKFSQLNLLVHDFPFVLSNYYLFLCARSRTLLLFDSRPYFCKTIKFDGLLYDVDAVVCALCARQEMNYVHFGFTYLICLEALQILNAMLHEWN